MAKPLIRNLVPDSEQQQGGGVLFIRGSPVALFVFIFSTQGSAVGFNCPIFQMGPQITHDSKFLSPPPAEERAPWDAVQME